MIISIIVSSLLVFIVSIGLTVWTKRKYCYAMKWIWLGGGIWLAGIALKFGFSALANSPILFWLQDMLKYEWYLGLGSLYIGVLTGIFEIGITLMFALLIRKMTINPSRAIGIGVGAGAIEAVMIGLSQIANAVYALTGGRGSGDILNAVSAAAELNPLFFLLAPVERVIAILCHASSRVLTLYAVARKNCWYFVIGFLLMTGLDAVAGYAHLSGLLSRASAWWIELAILPFAVISVPLMRWCVSHWPLPDNRQTPPEHIQE